MNGMILYHYFLDVISCTHNIYRLFFQHDLFKPLNISSVRIIKTASNYGSVSEAITAFDACISGQTKIRNNDASQKYGVVIAKLIEAELTGNYDGIDDYIIKTFHAFTEGRKKIEIKIPDLVDAINDKKLLNNVIVDPEMIEFKNGETEFIRRSEMDNTNLLNPKLVKLFRNCEEIKMWMNKYKENNIYTFSLMALLSIIQDSLIRRLELVIWWKEFEDDGETKCKELSWIDVLWQSSSEEIVQKYKEKGFDIKYDEFSAFLYGKTIIVNRI